MIQSKFVQKPFLTLIVVALVVAAILFIESQKPDLSKAYQDTTNLEDVKESVKSNEADGISRSTQNIQETATTAVDNGKIITEDPAIAQKKSQYPKAPNFVGIERWINSEPLSIEQLRGKVVLVDFWTYTCINCIRTLPYLKEWHEKYSDKGLVIVGVHTPEFQFEKKYENVLKAVNDYKLKYPVAQDNIYATWSVYQNRYWPHKYLVDIDGYIVYDHIGEGAYDETEHAIQLLLQERMERLNQSASLDSGVAKPEEAVDVNYAQVGTPEIYFGYQFSRGNFGNPEGFSSDEVIDYKFPSSIKSNNVYLQGKWKSNADNMELVSEEGSVLLVFKAKVANIVAGSENGSEASVLLDNEVENDKNKGNDVILKDGKSLSDIKEFKLYNLASAENYDIHTINIDVAGKGFKIYTFTFG